MPRTVWLYCRSFEKSISRPKLPLCFTSECVNSWNTSKSHMTLYKQKDSTLPPARYDVLRAANGLILLSREVLGPTLVESIVCVWNNSLPAFFLFFSSNVRPFGIVVGPSALHWAYSTALGLQHCRWAFRTALGLQHCRWAFSTALGLQHCTGPSALSLGLQHCRWAFSTALGLRHCLWAFSIVVGLSALSMGLQHSTGPSALSLGLQHCRWAFNIAL